MPQRFEPQVQATSGHDEMSKTEMNKRQSTGILRRLFGDRGEHAAGRYLRRQGLRILARQFSTQWGELDLICLDGDCVVFVEVKTRRSNQTGSPAEAVDRRKQIHLTKAALYWLKKNGLLEHRCRFDVVSVVWPKDARKPTIEHERNAFSAAEVGQMF